MLAKEVGASVRTISVDVRDLAKEYPEITVAQGNGGGVRFQKHDKQFKGLWSDEQQNAVMEAIKVLQKPFAKILGEMLLLYGSLRNKATIENALEKMLSLR